MRKDKLENIIKFILNRQKKNPEQSVVISADKKVRYEKVMELLDMLQRNDIYKVELFPTLGKSTIPGFSKGAVTIKITSKTNITSI